MTFRPSAGINSPSLRVVRGPSVVVVRVLAVLLTLLFVLPSAGTASASTKGKLDWARHRLHTLEGSISSTQRRLVNVKKAIVAQQSQLHALQSRLNLLAGKLADMQAAFEHTRTLIANTHSSLVTAEREYRRLRSRIDLRARDLYEQGPGNALEFFFGATSLADLSDGRHNVRPDAVHDEVGVSLQ